MTGCANSASVQGGSCAGGIVGTFYNAGTVSGNANTAASITSSSFAGGIVGNLQNADISSLPSTVPEGILAENNVSATPLNAITAPLKGPYAYNNTPSDFTVRDNGSAWDWPRPERRATPHSRAPSQRPPITAPLSSSAA